MRAVRRPARSDRRQRADPGSMTVFLRRGGGEPGEPHGRELGVTASAGLEQAGVMESGQLGVPRCRRLRELLRPGVELRVQLLEAPGQGPPEFRGLLGGQRLLHDVAGADAGRGVMNCVPATGRE